MMEWVRAENANFLVFPGAGVLNRNISGHSMFSIFIFISLLLNVHFSFKKMFVCFREAY